MAKIIRKAIARDSSLMLSASTRVILSVIFETLPNFGPSSNQQSVTGAGLKDRLIKFCNCIFDFSLRCHFCRFDFGRPNSKNVFRFLNCGWSSGTPTRSFLPHNFFGRVKSKPGKTTAPLGKFIIPFINFLVDAREPEEPAISTGFFGLSSNQ